jgi:hypothetical protein
MPHSTEQRRTDEPGSNRPSEFGTWTLFESGPQRGRRHGNRSVSSRERRGWNSEEHRRASNPLRQPVAKRHGLHNTQLKLTRAYALFLETAARLPKLAAIVGRHPMRATIQKLNLALSYCDARSDNDILFAFRPPTTGLQLRDVIEFDHAIIEASQTARNITTGERFEIHPRERDIHYLRLPAAHGSSRFPSPERFNDA